MLPYYIFVRTSHYAYSMQQAVPAPSLLSSCNAHLSSCSLLCSTVPTSAPGPLCVQLAKSQDLLKLSQQPYHYLLEGMKARDEQIGVQAKAMEDMEARLSALKEERGRLVRERNEAAADLEKLLAHKEVCTLVV